MSVESVVPSGNSEAVKLRCVSGGTPEDNTFAKATPSGSLELQIDNPSVKGQLKVGQRVYVDITPAK